MSLKKKKSINLEIIKEVLGEPERVPEVEPETEEEKDDFARALRRRELRLILAGKKQPGDSHELKKLFTEK